MKNFKNKKALLVLISIALLLTAAVNSTLAFLTDKSEEVTNTFKPTTVDITITDDIINDVKQNVTITNGDVKAFVRAKVVANWMVGGKIVAGWTDNIVYNMPDWYQDGGFYYYKDAVEAGATITPTLFGDYKPTRPDGIPTNAELVMDIIVQAVQAEGIGTTNPVEAFAKLKPAATK